MPIRLDGQVALVTGAGRGLGRSFALDLARHGARVVVNDLGGTLDGGGADLSVSQAVVDEIVAAGGEAVANGDSVATYEGGYNMVRQAMDTWGRLDIVVSNAGFLRDRALHNMTEEDWDAVLKTHLYGAYNILHHAWPAFRQQSYGRVILTSSNSGYVGNFGQSNYAAAKAGLIGLMNTAKIEGEKYNVMVNCIGPGATTRMTSGMGPSDRAPMSPDLVAPAVTFLASPECKSSGVVVEASGGTFGRVAFVRNERVTIEEPTADKFAEQWDAITNLDGAKAWWSFRELYADHDKAARAKA